LLEKKEGCGRPTPHLPFVVYAVIINLKRNKGGRGALLWFCWWAMTSVLEKKEEVKEGEEEEEEHEKGKKRWGGTRTWNSIVPSLFVFKLFEPTKFSKVRKLASSGGGLGKSGLEGVQSRPPFYFSFFSNFLNLRHRFATNMNLSTFLFFVFHPYQGFFIDNLDDFFHPSS